MANIFRRQTIVPPRVVLPPVPDVDLAPSQPAGYRPSNGQPVTLPGAYAAPAGAVPVDQVGDANLAPSAIGTLVTIPVPQQLRFRIAGVGFGADDEVALRFLTWSILINGDPASSGYGSQPAAIGSLRQLSHVFLLVGNTAVVTIQATISSTAALTYRYICRVQGWFYSEREL